MKKAILFMMIILMLSGMIGCSQDAELYAVELLYTESTSAAAEESEPTASEEPKEYEKEDSEEISSELAVSDVHENNPESAVTTTSPTLTKPAASSTSPPTITDTPSEPTTASSPSPTEQDTPAYTQKDFDEIIIAIREYAEGQTELKFIWNPGLKQDQFVGWRECLAHRVNGISLKDL